MKKLMKLLNKTRVVLSNMKFGQRIAIGVSLTIAFFVIGFAIAESYYHAFDLEDTWFTWLPIIAFVGWIWYELLAQE